MNTQSAAEAATFGHFLALQDEVAPTAAEVTLPAEYTDLSPPFSPTSTASEGFGVPLSPASESLEPGLGEYDPYYDQYSPDTLAWFEGLDTSEGGASDSDSADEPVELVDLNSELDFGGYGFDNQTLHELGLEEIALGQNWAAELRARKVDNKTKVFIAVEPGSKGWRSTYEKRCWTEYKVKELAGQVFYGIKGTHRGDVGDKYTLAPFANKHKTRHLLWRYREDIDGVRVAVDRRTALWYVGLHPCSKLDPEHKQEPTTEGPLAQHPAVERFGTTDRFDNEDRTPGVCPYEWKQIARLVVTRRTYNLHL
jgi:hypothetical protein